MLRSWVMMVCGRQIGRIFGSGKVVGKRQAERLLGRKSQQAAQIGVEGAHLANIVATRKILAVGQAGAEVVEDTIGHASVPLAIAEIQSRRDMRDRSRSLVLVVVEDIAVVANVGTQGQVQESPFTQLGPHRSIVRAYPLQPIGHRFQGRPGGAGHVLSPGDRGHAADKTDEQG